MLNDYYAFREEMVERVKRDLVGPSSAEEVITDPPITRYAAGMLFPRRAGKTKDDADKADSSDTAFLDRLDPAQDIDAGDDTDETTAADPPVALANVRYPSSMGMTFAVDPTVAAQIVVKVTTARYEPQQKDAVLDQPLADEPNQPRRSVEQVPWKRIPIDIPAITLDVSVPSTKYEDLVDAAGNKVGLQLFYRVRSPDQRGAVPLTLVLLNDRIVEQDAPGRDADTFFQASLAASAKEAGSAPFVERSATVAAGISDRDLRSYRLLYRQAHTFAIGHGCSVNWQVSEQDSARAVRIDTTFVPTHEVPLADSNPDIRAQALQMLYLATGERSSIIADLRTFCAGYADWINERQAEATTLEAELQDIAQEHLNDCNAALARMRGGVDVLETDAVAWQAFVLANTAMLNQRSRAAWIRAGKPTAAPEPGVEHQWRPFQMAFILLCLRGIVEPTAEERDYADLLWFPTGGGKTEAYLGLIAFTVFLRRLRNSDGGGVTALMRYTLRLLTIQQFERATLLICALESLRRKRTDLGKEPISIGLWVGQGATPNSIDEARTALNALRAGKEVVTGNPVQVRTCPWCGHPLDHRNYAIAADKSRMIVACRRNDCDFKDSLPVHLVDDDVYRYRPTLIIATADKFAGITWREQAAEIFNLKTHRNPKQHPPELIIQDELHLISGPLGTLVGLYETAVDALCTENGIRPKVIASTATIRRAEEQGQGLFNRKVRQFPPPGIDASNSYFAVEAPKGTRGTRRYVGLMAPAVSHTTLMVRTYAILLQSALEIPGTDDARDPYWTLVGYFNSLRVLGGARMQVQDDVDDRIKLLAAQSKASPRTTDELCELTSREPSSDIPEHLKRMAVSLSMSEKPFDVILATNMISVGVDIDRLGLMAVMGQPQSTSEYIQATSRVGRSRPGLVFVLLNAARSRDRSHYESFVSYHSALYRQVESTSVTPFSARARDRALHAVFITLVRMMVEQLRNNDDAARASAYRTELERIKELIVRRAAAVEPGEVGEVERELDTIIEHWITRIGAVSALTYRDKDANQALIAEASKDEQALAGAFPTLWSLRDVDKETKLRLIS